MNISGETLYDFLHTMPAVLYEYAQSRDGKVQVELAQLKYILPTMFDQRTHHSSDILRQLRRLFHKQICDPIRYNVRLSEAAVRGRTIFEYRTSASSAKDYGKLLWRVQQDGQKDQKIA